jgi:hypothetical protein
MGSDSEDTWGCILGAIFLIGGGVWLYNNYEIKERARVPTIAVQPVALSSSKPTIPRPTGTIDLLTDKGGSKWTLDADSVSGPRKARQAWVVVDSSKDKTESVRTTRTLYLIDCDTTAARILSEAKYGTSASPVSAESHAPKDAKIDYFPPHTTGGAVVRNMCDAAFGP